MTAGPAFATSGELGAVLNSVWAMLEGAVGDAAAALRTPVVIGLNATAPDGRVMVLRGCDRNKAQLIFHSDARSPKMAALADDPRVAVVGYDAVRLVQLRLRGRVCLETRVALIDAIWSATRRAERRNYATALAPGATLDVASDGQPDAVDALRARGNFARLVIDVTAIDWLSLASKGHRRAVFVPCGEGWAGKWCVP